MNPLRTALLAGSRSAWMRHRATRYRFVRRAVSRFMPGETLDAALEAAARLRGQGIDTILTHLGENVTDATEAEAVASHYLQVLERVRAAGLDAEVSVKPTQLGLDLGREQALAGISRIAAAAASRKNRVWIDMESSAYVDATLDLFRRLRQEHENVGVCLQSYLRRTSADLDTLLPLRPAIRLVKGAYKEPSSLAFPRRREVDESFFDLAVRMLGDGTGPPGAFLGIGTHDPLLIRRLQEHATAHGISRDAFEFELLYGIQRQEQARLAAEECRIRVLISYGDYWFPWYMRRLAERPANVLFVLRSLVSG